METVKIWISAPLRVLMKNLANLNGRLRNPHLRKICHPHLKGQLCRQIVQEKVLVAHTRHLARLKSMIVYKAGGQLGVVNICLKLPPFASYLTARHRGVRSNQTLKLHSKGTGMFPNTQSYARTGLLHPTIVTLPARQARHRIDKVRISRQYGQPQRRWTVRDGLPPQSSRLDNMVASSYQSPERFLSRGPSAARPDSSTRSAQTMQPPPSVDRYSPPRKSSASSYLPSGGKSSARRRDPNDMAKKERSDQFRGEGAFAGTGQNDFRGRPSAGSPLQQNSNVFDSHSSTSNAHGRNLASSRPFSQTGESYYGMFSAIRARQLSNSPTSNRVGDSSQRFLQRSSRNTPNHYAGSHASVPSNSDGATVIKGTQYSDDGCEIEMGVPRPLQDPAWEHRQRRSEHYRDVQRKEW
ncbi:hypothetical protein KC360_g16 [Hortaea werneckii]|nr:hypothetical protein KC344_g15 [Hortaea werneckii]KAI7180519.1 hypothetical protein KC360_g16 [Hortaea werneckii]